MKLSQQELKICPVCNRVFENRKKWRLRGVWEQIVYCSDKCRKNRRKKIFK